MSNEAPPPQTQHYHSRPRRERQMSLLFSRSPFVTAGHLQTVVASLRYCRYKWLCRGGESKLVSVWGEQGQHGQIGRELAGRVD